MTLAPDNSALQVFYGTLPLIGTALLAVWNNNARLAELSKRIDELGASLNKRIDDLIGRVGRVEDRLSDLEKGIRLVRS